MMNEEAAFTVRDVCKSFRAGRRTHAAVTDVSLDLDRTSSLGIVGESGSGKSTLSRLLVGLTRPTSGLVNFNGLDVSRLLVGRADRRYFRRSVQLVGQDTTSSFNPRHKLKHSIIRPAMQLAGMDSRDAERRAGEVLEMLEVPRELADRFPSEVSGGQRQRFAIARALVVRPRVLVCDEVVSALDVSVQGAVLNQLKDYCTDYDCGMVFVSHGLPATAYLCRDLAVMYDGRIVEQANTITLLENHQHEYTRSLVNAYRTTSGESAPRTPKEVVR
jgi:ABC-type dipeptide/oligopeptide/nickel transport system ATPase subunit